MDMQRILKSERLQTTTRNSWMTSWAPQILQQSEVEKAGCKAVAATLQILDNSKFIIVYELVAFQLCRFCLINYMCDLLFVAM